jgi:hypothetical protein
LGGFTSNGLDFSTEEDMDHVIVTRVMELFLSNVVGSIAKALSLKGGIFKPEG